MNFQRILVEEEGEQNKKKEGNKEKQGKNEVREEALCDG